MHMYIYTYIYMHFFVYVCMDGRREGEEGWMDGCLCSLHMMVVVCHEMELKAGIRPRLFSSLVHVVL